MNILITGGTGLIGRQLCAQLQSASNSITVLSRKPESVTTLCGPNVRALSSLTQWTPDMKFDAVVNLAGAPIAGQRWTSKRKNILRQSRIALTDSLVQRMAAAEHTPAALLSGSAIGYSGDCCDINTDESAGPGSDFGAELCQDWEHAALRAEELGVRTCLLRTGLVLSTRGGMLKQMLLPFRMGLGASIGDGQQWMSWIHIDDQLAIMLRLLEDESCSGPYNLCAPKPVRNADFSRALASALQRPLLLRAPAAVLNPLLGESAGLLLGGQKVAPERIGRAGYRFRHPDLSAALADLLQAKGV